MNEEQLKIWNIAIEMAARSVEEFHTNNVGMVHQIAAEDAKRIRKLKIDY